VAALKEVISALRNALVVVGLTVVMLAVSVNLPAFHGQGIVWLSTGTASNGQVE
jgi:hypothetical protein